MVSTPGRQAFFHLNPIEQFHAGLPNHASRLHPIVKARLPVVLIALSWFGSGCTTLKHTAVNQLGDECMSTPAVCDSRIYLRVAQTKGELRQEMLYCLGKK